MKFKKGLVIVLLLFTVLFVTIYSCNERTRDVENMENSTLVHPIMFSMPKEKIIDNIVNKEKMLSSLIPGKMETYIYYTEKDYYHEYQVSMFAMTTKKGGWDCMRHYEIMANGCIPYFPKIEECPDKTMVLFPKDLVKRGNGLYAKYGEKSIEDLTFGELEECKNLIEELLAYTRDNLTTENMAKYVLEASNHGDVKKVLFLSGSIKTDYLRCLTLQGLKRILGKDCHDYPKINHIYNGGVSDYGRGFTISGLVSHDLHDDDLNKNVEDDIKNKKYDIVIYGSYHRGMPFYGLVQQYYDPENIVLLCGEDIHECTYDEYSKKGHHVFVRELT